MKNLTTPQAILCGFGLVALAIASIPYSSQIIKPAYASNGVHKVAICDKWGDKCADLATDLFDKENWLKIWNGNNFRKYNRIYTRSIAEGACSQINCNRICHSAVLFGNFNQLF